MRKTFDENTKNTENIFTEDTTNTLIVATAGDKTSIGKDYSKISLSAAEILFLQEALNEIVFENKKVNNTDEIVTIVDTNNIDTAFAFDDVTEEEIDEMDKIPF